MRPASGVAPAPAADSLAEPNTPSSCEPCRAICQNALLPRVGSCPCRKPREPSDIIPRCRSLVPPCATQKREKWTTFTPPAAGLSRRYRGRLSHRRSHQAILVAGGKLRTHGEQCGQACGLHQIPPVIIDAILKAGIAGSIGACLALEHDRAAVGEDHPVPDQQDAALAEGNAIVVFANDAGA